MKKKDLEKKLKELGWEKRRSGSKHDVWGKDDRAIPVPRHKEINERTAQSIIKNASK